MVDSLGMSQMSYSLTLEINKMGSLNRYVDTIVFYNKYDRIINPPHFAMLQEQQAWGFDGPVISTDLATTKRLINCPRPKKKYFYIWTLEWLYGQNQYDLLSYIYLHPEIELVARNKHHHRIIEKCWKKPVTIIEEFNHEEIIKMVEDEG